MIPASPTGVAESRSQMSRSSAVMDLSTPSSVRSTSPWRARRTSKPPTTALSYAWFGWLSSSMTRFDASTTLLMLRIPRCARRDETHDGEGPTVTPLMTAAENIPHLSAAVIVTGTLRAAPCGPGSSRGPRSAEPKCAARTRATPR